MSEIEEMSGKTRLSKRMKKILQLLWEKRNSVSMEDTKEHMVSFRKMTIAVKSIMAGVPKPEIDDESLQPTEEDVEIEWYERISLSLKEIIVELEPELKSNYEKMMGEYGCVEWDFLKHSNSLHRWHISLPELVAGRLFPKGRDYKYYGRCKHVDGYEDALKKATKLQATYLRTLRSLMGKRVVGIFTDEDEKRILGYFLADNALSVLTRVGLLNILERS